MAMPVASNRDIFAAASITRAGHVTGATMVEVVHVMTRSLLPKTLGRTSTECDQAHGRSCGAPRASLQFAGRLFAEREAKTSRVSGLEQYVINK